MLVSHAMVREVIVAKKNITVKQGIEILYKRRIGAVLIIDKEQACIGIFTERDALRAVALNIPLDAKIEEVMTTNVYTVTEDSTLKEAKRIMRYYKIKHLPVLDSKGRVSGLLSKRQIIDELFER